MQEAPHVAVHASNNQAPALLLAMLSAIWWLTVFSDDNHLARQDISDPLEAYGPKGTVLRGDTPLITII